MRKWFAHFLIKLYNDSPFGKVFSKTTAYATTSTHRITTRSMDSPSAENADRELSTPWEITQGHREPPRWKMITYKNPMSTAKNICTRFSATPIPLPLIRFIICPSPNVTLDTATAHLMLSFAIALNRNPRKISVQGNGKGQHQM